MEQTTETVLSQLGEEDEAKKESTLRSEKYGEKSKISNESDCANVTNEAEESKKSDSPKFIVDDHQKNKIKESTSKSEKDDEKSKTSNKSECANVIDEAQESKKSHSPKFIVNDQLKEKLEKHGISKSDADNFLLGFLLKDKDFKNLVKANFEDENSSDDETADVRMTRSKLKEVMQNSPFKPWTITPRANVEHFVPAFTEIQLSENDDDDEEYKPTEYSFGSDTQDAPTLNTPELSLDCIVDSPRENVGNAASTTEAKVTSTAEGELVIVEPSNADIISKRTRSKHSLESTSIDTLEAAFEPPDSTADMYDMNIGDYDWQKWLSDLMKDGVDMAEDEDDPIADPDFYFTPDQEKPDKEDFRDDKSVRVSKKELHGLLDEVENMRNDGWQPMIPDLNESTQSTADSEDCTPKTKHSNNAPVDSSIPFLHMTKDQIEKLRQQLCQHVQLLAQSNILCRNQTLFEEYVIESKHLLQELMDIGHSQMKTLKLTTSNVIPWSLSDAISLTELDVPPSEPSIRLVRMERMKGHVSIPLAVAEVIANSKVFMCKELLPISAPVEHTSCSSKLPFRPAEDCLIASGMAQMAGLPNYARLISEHMLPTKSEKQILSRIRNVVYCRNQKDTVNPIRKYQTCKLLPKSRIRVKYVNQETAKKPIDMKGMLPNWLLALKPVHIPEDSSDDYSQAESIQWGYGRINSTPMDTETAYNTSSIVTSASPFKNVMVPYVRLNQGTNTKALGSADCIITSSPLKGIMVPYIPVSQSANINMANPALQSSIKILTPIKSKGDKTPVKILPKTSVHMVSPKISNVVDPVAASDVKIKPISIAGPSSYSTTNTQPSSSLSHPNVKTHRGKLIKMQSQYDSVTVLSSDDEAEEIATAVIKQEVAKQKMCDQTPVCTVESEDDDISDNDLTTKQEPEKQKHLKVKFSKTETGYNASPSGSFLQKIHPRLSGKKRKSGSRDSRRLRNASRNVRALEEDTIVQLDPSRMEKEHIFADGYQRRVKEALKNHPDTYKKYLETLVKYSERTNSPIDLYAELSLLLQDWPDLIQAFAPFLMPEQALECGLHEEHGIYFKARKFLRQLEIQFSDNPDTMKKILDVFHNVADTAIYREEEMMKSILVLLKGHPYLQDEFLTFFDSTQPPKIYFDNDFEEVDLTEDMINDPNISQYEHVSLPIETLNSEEGITPGNNLKRGKKRRISRVSAEDDKSPAKIINLTTNGIDHLETTVDADDEQEVLNTDCESEDEISKIDGPDTAAPSVPPDITVISEDALSSSPFKRITGETSMQADTLLRPDTPTGIRLDNTRSITLPNSPSQTSKSTCNDIPAVPATPSGKIRRGMGDAQPEENDKPAGVIWTHDKDELILTTCKEHGETGSTFDRVSKILNCEAAEVEHRWKQLLKLLTGIETETDTSQESGEDWEEESCDSNL